MPNVHRDTISVAVLDESGRLIMQSVLATRASAILDFIHGLRGTLHVTFEEGTHSAWLYDLLARRVARLAVCNPRKNALLKSGSKSDAIDARKLAELLRAGLLSAVYHGESSALEVQHLARTYTTLTEDTTRVMGRLKAVFRGQAIGCAGKKLYGKHHRDVYLAQLVEGGLRRRAECLYQELLIECRKHASAKLLQSVPYLGPVRAALLIGPVQTPHRFRTKRQFWAYCGLAIETRDSAEYQIVGGQIERKKKRAQVRGLNWNHNHELKNLFKSAATTAATRAGVFREFYLGLLAKGMQPEMARLTLARKIAAIALKIWKKGRSVRHRTSEATSSLSTQVHRKAIHRRTSAGTERSGPRVSILAGFRRTVSRRTVCSLGQPNKAIGLESQIEPWLAPSPARCLRGAQKPDPTRGKDDLAIR